MTLRTTAIIAGVLGLLMWVAGLFSNAVRADREVVATATPDTAIVVVGPEVLALPGIERIVVVGSGGVQAHTARPLDLDAWLLGRKATGVDGFLNWDKLATTPLAKTVVPSPSASPSAGDGQGATGTSPSPSAATQASATPSPSAQPSEEPAPPTEADIVASYGAGDVWRHDWRGVDRLAVTGTMVAPGESLVFFSEDGSPLHRVDFYANRPVNDGWISPLIWIGAGLALLGALAALSAVVDTRPLQAKVEKWLTARQRKNNDGPRPGSRRERRLAGATLPPVELTPEPDPVAEHIAAQKQQSLQEGGAS